VAPGPVPPRVVVVGLGPAGAAFVPEASRRALAQAARAFVRTARHPAVEAVAADVESFDRLYDRADTLDEVYAGIVDELVAAARSVAEERGGDPDAFVAYAVPGSPLVAERTVSMLRRDDRVRVEVVPAPSFVDLAWDRLGVDPVDAGVRLVDGARFAVEAAGERGPVLVAQCATRQVLSDIKLAADDVAGEGGRRRAVLLHHLGLDDEQVVELAWEDLDRRLDPDHLTALWIPRLAPPVGVELARLDELVHTLRARCPWDRSQSHGSLARHLLEETYEALDAIETVAAAEPRVPREAVDHLEEELGDLLFQVCFHAVLGEEEGRFTLADVARGVHDKLVARHPHVFGDAEARTAEEVAAAWERRKMDEKGRAQVTEGIPSALPALALAAELLRKGESVGLPRPEPTALRARLAEGVGRLDGGDAADAVGELLLDVAALARAMGVDPESALRVRTRRLRQEIESGGAG